MDQLRRTIPAESSPTSLVAGLCCTEVDLAGLRCEGVNDDLNGERRLT